MQWRVPEADWVELSAAFLQAAVTVGLAGVCALLWRRYGKAAYLIWAAAWVLYATRLGAIISFVSTHQAVWLFWHQVATGWTALALLWAALSFAQRATLRPAHALLAAFPIVWSYIATYRLDSFLLAAGPAVLFLSGATLLTAWVFWRHARSAGSRAAAFLAAALLLWGLHHLDYPFLRARGVWNPWGYYLDIGFVLATGLGILLLVQEDLSRGLRAVSSLSAVLQRTDRTGDIAAELLRGVLTLPAVRGGALLLRHDSHGKEVLVGTGVCETWQKNGAPAEARRVVEAAMRTGHAEIVRGAHARDRGGANADGPHAYVAALPVFNGSLLRGALVVVGVARDPFAALDHGFLVMLGQQVGAALANAELYRGLEQRTAALERLAATMVRQNEEERRRISRELHDETAQVLAAVNMQLGLAREEAPAPLVDRLDRALTLAQEGIRSIRRVTEDLRPSLLDQLGLVPALRGLADGFREQHNVAVKFDAPATPPAISDEAELALFRALQEGLANVARHADARSVEVSLSCVNGTIRLSLRDDGRGVTAEVLAAAAAEGRMGLAGMRERITALGGSLEVAGAGEGGHLCITLPVGNGS